MFKTLFIFSLIIPITFTQVLFQETGEVLSSMDIQVSSLVNEKIQKVYHLKGAHVNKGDLLVELDSSSIKAQIDAKKFEVKVIESQLMRAKVSTKDALREYKRYQELYSKKSTSKQSLDKYQSLHSMAVSDEQVLIAQIEEKKALLVGLQPTLKKYKIHAPFSGTILEDNDLSIGQLINSGDSLLRLCDLSKMKVRVQVPAIQWHNLQETKTIYLKFDGLQQKLIGKLTWIAQFVDPKTRTKSIEVHVDNPFVNNSRLLSPGMFSFIEFND
ncbi:MAG: efflux RND transporter periplasmic adaptor subunit [Candidatus Cloacimonetes bacterium]|nr:efflux RND transporter periplasmic adaptor subunit [Candidatus Cloacimonadota bacterium]